MIDRNIIKIIALGWPVTSALLTKGGWVGAHRIEVSAAFPEDPILWRLRLYSETDLHLRDIYCESETIAGLSVIRNNDVQSHTNPTDRIDSGASADMFPEASDPRDDRAL